MLPSSTRIPDAPAHILVISNDVEIGRIWVYTLEGAGHIVNLAEPGEAALQAAEKFDTDLCIVNCTKEQAAVINFCQVFKRHYVIPLLLLTHWSDEAHLLAAYTAGADEVTPHPISPRLLLAKINAWLWFSRTLPREPAVALSAGGFTLDYALRLLGLPDGRTVKLTKLEARLLFTLMKNPNQTQKYARIIESVWGYDYQLDDHTVLKNLVYRLRRKIKTDPNDPSVLVTDGDQGYCFSVDKSPVESGEQPVDDG